MESGFEKLRLDLSEGHISSIANPDVISGYLFNKLPSSI